MIYYFGDSHTAGFNDTNPIKDKYIHTPYSKYLTELLDMESRNFAKGGQNLVKNVNLLTSSIGEISQNAKIVIFQFQFFCNSMLRFENTDFYTKDVILSKGQDFYDNQELGISKEDSISLVNWHDKFEERRSWYEMERVFSIFDYLNTLGIKTYAIYWTPPFVIDLIKDERVVSFDDGYYVIGEPYFENITQATNGQWVDAHTSNTFNKKIAEKTFNFILNN